MGDRALDATPKVREAVEEIARCVRTRFTGNLVFDFKEGVPLSVKATECRKLGRKESL